MGQHGQLRSLYRYSTVRWDPLSNTESSFDADLTGVSTAPKTWAIEHRGQKMEEHEGVGWKEYDQSMIDRGRVEGQSRDI